jgi:hypothetical protein
MWPQPPQQQGALSGNPMQMLDLIGSIQRNEQMRREMAGRSAIGRALQGAITPDGIDPQKARAGMLSDPDLMASGMLPAALEHVQGLNRAQFDTNYAKNQAASSVFGSLPKNATDEQLRHYGVTLSRVLGPDAAPMITGHLDSLMRLRGKERANAIATLQSTAIGPAGTAQTVEAPPLPSGAPARQTLGERLQAQGPQAVGQAPGEELRQAGAAEASRAIEATGTTTAQYHADLDNLKQLSKVVEIGGPTVEIEKKFGQLASRFGLPSTINAEQLKGVEEFDKIANQISLNQSKLFHGSDAGLHTVVGANPATSMSRYGREGVIDMLQGNQDALDVTRKMWLSAQRNGAPANSYHQFVDRLSNTLDPRVFQFNRMNRENQQKFLSQIDPSELPDFEAKYQEAIRQKWVKPLKGQT